MPYLKDFIDRARITQRPIFLSRGTGDGGFDLKFAWRLCSPLAALSFTRLPAASAQASIPVDQPQDADSTGESAGPDALPTMFPDAPLASGVLSHAGGTTKAILA